MNAPNNPEQIGRSSYVVPALVLLAFIGGFFAAELWLRQRRPAPTMSFADIPTAAPDRVIIWLSNTGEFFRNASGPIEMKLLPGYISNQTKKNPGTLFGLTSEGGVRYEVWVGVIDQLQAAKVARVAVSPKPYPYPPKPNRQD